MKSFLEKHSKSIAGVLSGWDRVVFRGTLRLIANVDGMRKYLTHTGVLLKEFKEFAKDKTRRLIEASAALAEEAGRPNQYLASSKTSKDHTAQEIAERDNVTDGLICILRTVEPCLTYEIHRNRSLKKIELQVLRGKCMHLYHYWRDPFFGFMGARIQTWLPFAIQIWFNGREWLSHVMDREGIKYTRDDNCFPWISDFGKAQEFMDKMHTTNWPEHLHRISRLLNPAHETIFSGFPLHYYWTSHQTEWATDIAFKTHEDLARIYPQLVRGAMTAFSCKDVLRFLGKRPHVANNDEINSHYKERHEGVRIRHEASANSVKAYDKGGKILRAECTINNHRAFRVYRESERNPQGPKKNLPMSKGIVDLFARSQISQKINNRYLEALAMLDTSERVEDVVAPICKRRTRKGKSIRALRPWSKTDIDLFDAVMQTGLAGDFRNKDIVAHLFPNQKGKKVTSKVTYLLRLLREHKIICKLAGTTKYRLKPQGAKIIATVLLTQKATTEQLNKAAA